MEVSREIMPGDLMYEWNPEAYFYAGEKALECILLALTALRVPLPRRFSTSPAEVVG